MESICLPINDHPNVIASADHGATDVDVYPPQHNGVTVPTPVEGNQDLLRDREYIRLSIDQYIWDHHGRYGIDYPPKKVFRVPIRGFGRTRQVVCPAIEEEQGAGFEWRG